MDQGAVNGGAFRQGDSDLPGAPAPGQTRAALPRAAPEGAAPERAARRRHSFDERTICAFIFLLALAVYALTLAPDLTWAHWGADGGDFAAAAVAGRLPHPPGFPVFMALARLVVRFSAGAPSAPSALSAPAWRLHMLSALLAAAAAAQFGAVLLRRGYGRVVTLTAALSLAVAPLFWSQALIAEVYTAAAFFAVLTFSLALEPPETAPGAPGAPSAPSAPSAPRAFLGGLVWGLGLSVHPVLIFLAPLWLGLRRRSLPAWVGGLLLGLLPYVLLPWVVAGPQPWGDLRTFAGWLDYVTGRLYWGYAFALPLADWPQRLLAWAVLLVEQFTPAGAALALLGLKSPSRRTRSERWRMGMAFGAASLYAIGYNTTDSLVYLVPYLVFPALWLAEGLEGLVALKSWRRLRWWGLALPLAALLLNWNALDLHQDTAARVWWEATLAQAPADAVLVTAADAHTFALWYAQEALGLRQDVTVVDRDLWARPSYRAFLGVPAEQVTLDSAFGRRALCTVNETAVTCDLR